MKDKIQTFKNFIVSDCNSEAYNTCVSFVQNPFGKFIALCGPTATGKTHLMSAIHRAYATNFPNLKVKTATYEDIMSDYI